jgi:homoserine kinase type II
MAVDSSKIERVLRLYPDDCQPQTIEPLAETGGFSGARIWRLDSPRGPLCLRRWPPQHPSQERLEFIQAVLWHVDQEGFRAVPLPIETQHKHGYVLFAGHLWELTRWLPGRADYRENPSPAKLQNALAALARFHRAAATFPLADGGPVVSPGIVERLERLRELVAGRIESLRKATRHGAWPELAARGERLIEMFAAAAPAVLLALENAAQLPVMLQPCVRDVWHAHVLFEGDNVSGIVDFGAMRPENVAADVARLLGSLAGDDRRDWQVGLDAYERVRRLSADEFRLMEAFDTSTVLMGGLQWLEWLYLEERVFSDPAGVLARVDEFVSRLGHLVRASGGIDSK